MIARIVKTLREKGSANRTALATGAGLSYDRFITYLNWMTQKGFVTVDAGGQVRLTPEGAKVYEELVQWILQYVGGLRLTRFRSAQD